MLLKRNLDLNDTYCGALVYADDIVISCSSRRGLHRLLVNMFPFLYLILFFVYCSCLLTCLHLPIYRIVIIYMLPVIQLCLTILTQVMFVYCR